MKAYVGIDPGKSGAIAVLTDETAIVYKCPPTIPELSDVFLSLKASYDIKLVALEKVNAVRGNGLVSTFTFAQNFGAYQGMLSAFGLPYLLVAPKKWQKEMLDAGKGDIKTKSREVAARLYPEFSFKTKNSHNKADALHLARYAKCFVV